MLFLTISSSTRGRIQTREIQQHSCLVLLVDVSSKMSGPRLDYLSQCSRQLSLTNNKRVTSHYGDATTLQLTTFTVYHPPTHTSSRHFHILNNSLTAQVHLNSNRSTTSKLSASSWYYTVRCAVYGSTVVVDHESCTGSISRTETRHLLLDNRTAFSNNFQSLATIGEIDMFQYTEAFYHYSRNSPQARKSQVL